MIKTMKNGDIRELGFAITAIWAENKNNIKLSGKNMYYLIALKKELESATNQINEAFMVIGQQYGGELTDDGRLKIPDESIDVVNEKLSEIANETTDINYTPVSVREEDEFPIDLIDLLFDFIEMN